MKKQFLIYLSGICGFVLLTFAGYFIPGLTHKHEEAREPASIPKQTFDFTYLEAGALNSALSRSVLKDAKIVSSGEDVGVELGNFRAKIADGSSVTLCESYDRVELSFFAEGQAESGSKPSLTITGPCQVGVNARLTSPIWIPVSRIRSHEAIDFEETWNEKGEVSVRAKNIGDSWPQYWVLSEVKLSSSQSNSKQLSLDRYQILKHSTHPLMLLWR